MKLSLKWIAISIVCGIALAFLWRFGGCGNSDDNIVTTNTPEDSNFIPIQHKEYRPSSIPGVKGNLGTKLPKGVSESDVKEVFSIELAPDSPSEKPKHIDIITTKDGEVFVGKDSSLIRSITVTTIQPKILAFGFRFGAGLSAYRASEKVKVSPSGFVAPLEWNGWLQAPIGVVDLDGVGPGIQAKLYHDVYVGIAQIWRYDLGTESKVTVSFMF